jgi:hypothetical protein
MDTMLCPECGIENPINASNCRQCGWNLISDFQPPETDESQPLKTSLPRSTPAQPQRTKKANKIVIRIALGIFSLLIGAMGIFLLFMIGEGSGSGFYAFGAVAVIFGSLAFAMAKADRDGWWIYPLLLCAPITLIVLIGGYGDVIMLSLLMIVVTLVAASVSARGLRGLLNQLSSNQPPASH